MYHSARRILIISSIGYVIFKYHSLASTLYISLVMPLLFISIDFSLLPFQKYLVTVFSISQWKGLYFDKISLKFVPKGPIDNHPSLV